MLRKKFESMFSSHQRLIQETDVLCQLLRSQGVMPRYVPRTLLQLGAKYKAILKHDRDVLQKQLPFIKDENIHDQARQVLTAINKLFKDRHLYSADAAALENNSLPEAQHFNDAIKFMAERELYAADVRQYLQDLKEDIASTNWRDGSTSSEDDDSDDRAVLGDGMPRPVADINCALAESEMKRDDSSVGVLAKYEEVRRFIAKLGIAPILHPAASAFYRYHQEQIDTLSFVPLKEKAAAMTIKK